MVLFGWVSSQLMYQRCQFSVAQVFISGHFGTVRLTHAVGPWGAFSRSPSGIMHRGASDFRRSATICDATGL